MEKPNFETIKRHPYKTTAAALATAVIGAFGYSYFAIDNGGPAPKNSCTSEFFTTTHKGDPGASWITPFSGGRTGVELEVKTPDDSYGVQVAFKHPGDKEWAEISDMTKVNELGEVLLTLAIGKSDIEFGVQTVAPEGSKACKSTPEVEVALKGIGEYRNRANHCPWWNIGQHYEYFGIWVPHI